MNLITGTESAELFGGTVSPAVQHLIEVAPDAIYRQNPRSSRSNQLSTTLLKRRR